LIADTTTQLTICPPVSVDGDKSRAEEILRLAQEHDVPLRQDVALAQSLATLDIGRSVPPELFRAVAEVLSFVSQMSQ
jgi:flagellar biosynthesis protein